MGIKYVKDGCWVFDSGDKQCYPFPKSATLPLKYSDMPYGYPNFETGMFEIIPLQTVASETSIVVNGANLEIGQTHTIIFDNVEYPCTVWYDWYDLCMCLGNGTFFGQNGKGDNVPFLVRYSYEGGFFVCATEGEHTISCSSEMQIVTPMADDFISSDYKPIARYDVVINGDNAYISGYGGRYNKLANHYAKFRFLTILLDVTIYSGSTYKTYMYYSPSVTIDNNYNIEITVNDDYIIRLTEDNEQAVLVSTGGVPQ